MEAVALGIVRLSLCECQRLHVGRHARGCSPLRSGGGTQADLPSTQRDPVRCTRHYRLVVA
eukprot:9267212-Alexandrium_andersonii.AAC.1